MVLMIIKKYIVKEITSSGDFRTVVTGSTRYNKEFNNMVEAEKYIETIFNSTKWGLTLVILPIYKEEY